MLPALSLGVMLVMSAPLPARTPALVELFTSEGCSSCPPADEALASLAQTQPIDGVEIIPLGFHVDYWNYLGWADPFSSETFSARQGQYNAILGAGVFTPQAIVDGTQFRVGSGERGLREAIRERAREVKAQIRLTRTPGSATFSGTIQSGELPHEAEVFAALVEEGLRSEVTRGENQGRTLRLAPVVRRFRSLGRTSTIAAKFVGELRPDSTWAKNHLRLVVWAQDVKTWRVLAATSVAW